MELRTEVLSASVTLLCAFFLQSRFCHVNGDDEVIRLLHFIATTYIIVSLILCNFRKTLIMIRTMSWPKSKRSVERVYMSSRKARSLSWRL